tara:strand:- start:8898 stop:10769 length:1872 start_codon:yes stop_codon:yes gene_type:complete
VVDSENVNQLIKDLESMKDSLGSLTELMEGTQTVSDNLLTSFRDFATAGSSNTLWNAVSRFSSGIFPGFWSMQNKIRAVAVYMQYVEKKQKEQIKKEGEIAKTIQKQSAVRNAAFETYNLLQKKSLTVMQEMSLESDAYYQVLKAQLGAEEAKLKYKEQYKNILLENIDNEYKLSSAVGERIRNDEQYAKYFKAIDADKIKDLEKVIYFREQEEIIRKRVASFEGKKRTVDAQFSRGEIAADEYDAAYKAINEDQDKLKAQKDAATKTRKMVESETGIKLRPQTGGGELEIEGGDEKLSLREAAGKGFKSTMKKLEKRFKAISIIAGIIKSIKWLGKPMNRKLLLGYMKIGLRFLRSAMLYGLGLGLVIFAIIKSGIIGRIVDLVQNLKDNPFFEMFIKIVTFTLDNFFKIFEGIFTFFYGLFTGDASKVVDGLKTFIEGVVMFAVGMLGTLGTAIWFAVPSLLYEVGAFIISGIGDFISYMAEDVGQFATGAGALAGAFAGAKIGAAGGLPGILAGAIIGGSIGAIGGHTIGGTIEGKASGGRINRGGNILVGESGPEIISLPTNSFVTPAVQSRGMMGSNVTVNVSGRVGASDSELNEIARKIGQKINREMNKYGSSGYRA